MKIRTRHKLFRLIIVLGVLVFLFSLVDMFVLDSSNILYVLIAYASLVVLALLLYIGHKPDLSDDPVPATQTVVEPVPEPEAEAIVATEPVAAAEPEPGPEIEIVEVPRVRPRVTAVDVEGPNNFRCPFCSNTFALEATHIERRTDFRMNCPYCANSIRVPRTPKVARGEPIRQATEDDRAVYTCASCGEVLRITAPRSAMGRSLSVSTCPQCQSRDVARATAA